MQTQTTAKTIKLKEIAQRIDTHLRRLEAEFAKERKAGAVGPTLYYYASSYTAGNRVSIIYVSYQGPSNVTKADALEYLIWLDDGHSGRHYEALRLSKRAAGIA